MKENRNLKVKFRMDLENNKDGEWTKKIHSGVNITYYHNGE